MLLLMLTDGVDAKGSKQALHKFQLKRACEELLSRVMKFQNSFPVILAVVQQEREKRIALEARDHYFHKMTNGQ